MQLHASGDALAEGARFSESVVALCSTDAVSFIPKGVVRFASHEEANAADAKALARSMAELARRRAELRAVRGEA
jgi:hypothetical protein